MTNAHTREYEANGRRYRRIRGGWEVFTGFPGAPWMPEAGSAVPSEVWSAFEEQQKRDAEDDDPYSQPVRTLEGGEPLCDLLAADAALQVIASIADDLDDWAAGKRHRGFARRQARRLREHVAKVDAALGFRDEGDVS